jgi:hypothetical protein
VLISPLTPEFRLLIACSWLPPASKPGEVAELCAAGIDWTEFLALVRRHQVPSLAYKILRGEQIPGEVRRELKALSSSACAAALHAAGELARLSRAFAQADVAMMPLKGVMLSIQLFGDPATRHPGDLDLMVQPEDFTRAGELLLSLGYRCKLTRPMQQLLRSHSYECSYWHDRLQLLVDVHWSHELWTAPQIAELWTHCRERSWMGTRSCLLDGDALLLFLCDHGTKHKWTRIKWLSDIAMLLSHPRESPWTALFEMAARFDLEQSLAETALLVESWYGIDLPTPFHDFIAREGVSVKSVERMLAGREAVFSGFRRRKRSSWRMYVIHLMIQIEDLRRFPLPDPFVWLYYPLRPLFWFWRHFKVK